MTVRLNPVLAGLGTYPFVRLEQARRAAAGGGRRDHRLRDGRAARGDAGVHPRGVDRGDHAARAVPDRRRAAGAARGDRRLGGTALRRRRSTPAPRCSRRSAPRRPCSGWRNVFAGEHVVVPTPAYPVYDRGARFAGKADRSSCRCGRTTAGCPSLTASTGTASRCCGSTIRTTRRVRRRRSSSTRRPTALAREHGFVLASDEAYSELYFGGDPPVSALQVADRSQLVVSTRSPSAPRCPATARGSWPATRRSSPRSRSTGPTSASRRSSSSSAPSIAAWGDEEHVDRGARALPGQARRAAARAGGPGPALRGRRRVVLPLAGRAGDELAARWLEAGVVVAPGSFFGPAGEGYLRVALVPPLAKIEQAIALTELSVACSAALSPDHVPERGSASTVPVLRVAAEQQAVGAAQLAGLDDVAVGQRDERARGDVEARPRPCSRRRARCRCPRWRRSGSSRRR